MLLLLLSIYRDLLDSDVEEESDDGVDFDSCVEVSDFKASSKYVTSTSQHQYMYICTTFRGKCST